MKLTAADITGLLLAAFAAGAVVCAVLALGAPPALLHGPADPPAPPAGTVRARPGARQGGSAA